MREINLELPAYLTLQQYRDLDKVYSLDERLQTLHSICAITGLDIKVIKKWDLGTIKAVWETVSEIMAEAAKIEFYPILEFEGVQYGFTPMSKMSVDEYIDLDTLIADKTRNISEILSILYRPIKSHTITDMKFKIKSSFKVIFSRDNSEHLMDYYKVEEYDNDKRKEQAKIFEQFPASVALGALGFFLGVGNLSSLDSLISTAQMSKKQKKKMMKKEIEQYKNIMGGYTRYMSSAALPSFQSGERKTFSL